MGHIVGPFGVSGWIRIFPYTENVDGLLAIRFGGWERAAANGVGIESPRARSMEAYWLLCLSNTAIVRRQCS